MIPCVFLVGPNAWIVTFATEGQIAEHAAEIHAQLGEYPCTVLPPGVTIQRAHVVISRPSDSPPDVIADFGDVEGW